MNSVHIRADYGSLGDQLCLVGSARHYARRNPRVKVFVSNLPDVVQAYDDNLISHGLDGRRILCHPVARCRVKHRSPDLNYLGTYMAELGMKFKALPALELPRLPPLLGLPPRSYVCLQPYSVYARNPKDPKRFVQFLVNACRKLYRQPIVAGGSPSAPRDLKGVDYGYLGTHMEFLRCVQHAAFVLTPRSAAAHIASAYRVPSLIWVPDDGENWHLDYPDWPHYRTRIRKGPEVAASKLKNAARPLGSFPLTGRRARRM
jgi:hypothetical protein